MSSILSNLTKTEIEVLKLILDGMSNKEIENELYISHSTVTFHITNILKKSGCSNRIKLIIRYFKEQFNIEETPKIQEIDKSLLPAGINRIEAA